MAETTNNLFAIRISEGWVDETVYTIMGPEEDGVKHNLVISVDREFDTKEMTLKDAAFLRIESLKQHLNGLEILNETEKMLPQSERTIYEVVYKFVQNENKPVFQKQVFLIEKKRLYIFVASFTKKTIKTLGTLVDEMIDTFTPFTEKQVRFD
jgi:hypothetical protein